MKRSSAGARFVVLSVISVITEITAYTVDTVKTAESHRERLTAGRIQGGLTGERGPQQRVVGWAKRSVPTAAWYSVSNGGHHIDTHPSAASLYGGRALARFSNDGGKRDRARGHPSRRPREERLFLRMRSQSLISIVLYD